MFLLVGDEVVPESTSRSTTGSEWQTQGKETGSKIGWHSDRDVSLSSSACMLYLLDSLFRRPSEDGPGPRVTGRINVRRLKACDSTSQSTASSAITFTTSTSGNPDEHSWDPEVSARPASSQDIVPVADPHLTPYGIPPGSVDASEPSPLSSSQSAPPALANVKDPWEARRPSGSQGLPMSLDHYFFCWASWPIYAALTAHGIMQGTDCNAATLEATSPLAYLKLPEGLRPTPMQLAMAHLRWIDRFPFPLFRDNMILLNTLIDVDQFVRDLFLTPSLRLKQDKATWDPNSWIMSPAFGGKWGLWRFPLLAVTPDRSDSTWRMYLIFMGLCLISEVVGYLYILETRAKPLEELGALFGDEFALHVAQDGRGIVEKPNGVNVDELKVTNSADQW